MGTAWEVFSSANFWLTLLLTNVILLVPIIAYRFWYLDVKPTLSDRVRMKQRLTKSKSRSKELHVLRRASTLRRSTRSLRSGYAFAHQEGFGELITSGINMRQRAEDSEKRNPVELTRVKKLNSGETNGNRPKAKSSNNPDSHAGHAESHGDDQRHVIFCEKL